MSSSPPDVDAITSDLIHNVAVPMIAAREHRQRISELDI